MQACEYISDLILRSAPLRASRSMAAGPCVAHPSRRLLRKLLRMMSVFFTGSCAGYDGLSMACQPKLRSSASGSANRLRPKADFGGQEASPGLSSVGPPKL